MSDKPIVGITMGDPASIGPEITAKVFDKSWIYEKCNPCELPEIFHLKRQQPL